MNFIKKYWTLIAIVAAFLIGMFLSGGGDKDLTRKLELDREQLKKENQILNKRVKARESEIKEIELKRSTDSIRNAERLNASNTEIKRLKSKIRATSFKNHTTDQLDSIARVLYGPKALH